MSRSKYFENIIQELTFYQKWNSVKKKKWLKNLRKKCSVKRWFESAVCPVLNSFSYLFKPRWSLDFNLTLLCFDNTIYTFCIFFLLYRIFFSFTFTVLVHWLTSNNWSLVWSTSDPSSVYRPLKSTRSVPLQTIKTKDYNKTEKLSELKKSPDWKIFRLKER